MNQTPAGTERAASAAALPRKRALLRRPWFWLLALAIAGGGYYYWAGDFAKRRADAPARGAAGRLAAPPPNDRSR